MNNNFKNMLLRYLLGPESRIEYCGNEDMSNAKYDPKKIFKKMFKTQLLKIKYLGFHILLKNDMYMCIGVLVDTHTDAGALEVQKRARFLKLELQAVGIPLIWVLRTELMYIKPERRESREQS